DANRKLDEAQSSTGAGFSPAQQKGFEFLLALQHEGVFDASHGGKTFPDPAITAFGLLALQTKPKELRSQQEQVAIEQGLQWLLANQNEDGSFGKQLLNYTTSVAVGALARSDLAGATPALQKAQKFLLQCQYLEQNGYQSS